MTKEDVKTAETTPEQFAIFCESVEFYINLLHLGEWKAYLYHDDEFAGEPIGECFAIMHCDHPGRVADFVMRKTLHEPLVDKFDPWIHGKHEVCELLLADLNRNCRFTFAAVDVEQWVHAVIRRLERALPDKTGDNESEAGE